MKRLNLSASLGVAVREFPTSTGEVDYALFVDGKPVGVVEAKREEAGEHITDVEVQSGRYANSTFKWIKNGYAIRFAYVFDLQPEQITVLVHRQSVMHSGVMYADMRASWSSAWTSSSASPGT